MNKNTFERNIRRGKSILFAGLIMLFEKGAYSIHIGIIMIILSSIIIKYYEMKYNIEITKKLIIDKLTEDTNDFMKENEIKKQKHNPNELIEIINTFGKKYKLDIIITPFSLKNGTLNI